MPNMALFPDRATTVPALMGVVDGFPDTVHKAGDGHGDGPPRRWDGHHGKDSAV